MPPLFRIIPDLLLLLNHAISRDLSQSKFEFTFSWTPADGMGLHNVNQLLVRIGVFFTKYGGLMFIAMMIVSNWWLALDVACPANGYDCESWTLIAVVIIFNVLLHLYLFHSFSEHNCVSHWQRQSCVADLCRSADDEDPALQEVYPSAIDMSSRSYGKFCHDCNREAPLRSHHCPLCQICVLRKDHHCFITGACVGLGNQKYFMTFLFWGFVGLTCSAYISLTYLKSIYGDFLPFGFFKLVGPIALARYILGYQSGIHALASCIFSFSISGLLGCVAFLVLQIYYTWYGYTMYEYHSSSMREAFDGDGETVNERFRLVFGANWALNFIFPLWWEEPVLTPKIANNLFRVRSKLL